MTLRDEHPIHRCAVKGCAFIGRWPEGGLCPSHRADPLTRLTPAPEPEDGDGR